MPCCRCAGAARRSRLHVPGRRRSRRRAGVSRDRPPDARRLLPFRQRRGPSAGGASARGPGLRCRWTSCPCRSLRAAPAWGCQAPRANEIVMAPLLFGVVLLVLALVALNAFTKVNPQTAAAVLKAGGGLGALAVAGVLGARGRIDIAIPLGLTGLGLLG